MEKKDNIKIKAPADDERARELQRLIACYQIASRDDKNVVWAALNKYCVKIDRI